MASLTFEESLRLREVFTDTFENIHEPWTWPFSTVVPGGLLMSECAVAAYQTVPQDFVLDSLHTHFLGGPKPKLPMQFKVARLSNGKRFAVRAVTIAQNNVVMLTAQLSFVKNDVWTGLAMTHAVSRQTSHKIDGIEIDDLEVGRSRLGSFMKFQRLPLVFRDHSESPQSGISCSAAHIIPPITDSAGTMNHILGIVNLSDYHVMSSPLQLSKVPSGLPAIGDKTRRPTKSSVKVGTTLNHSIHFHLHDGFRADELTYIEAETSWAKDGRAMISSKIFSNDGLLIATCVQEAFYVLKEDLPLKSQVKL